MNIAKQNWMQIEHYLQLDNRVILPLGSTEQHAYLSLCTDHILASRLAEEATQDLSIPVYPGVPYGIAPYFSAFPGSVTIRPETYFAFIIDILDSFYRHGFRRILLLNGHGGNSPIQSAAQNWLIHHPDAEVILHNWWATPAVMSVVKQHASIASHASWMENFPWTRIEGVEVPNVEKPMIDIKQAQKWPPEKVRLAIGDGNYGGYYIADDTVMQNIWQTAIDELRELVEKGWG